MQRGEEMLSMNFGEWEEQMVAHHWTKGGGSVWHARH